MKIELWHVYVTEDINSTNLIKQAFNKLWEFKIIYLVLEKHD